MVSLSSAYISSSKQQNGNFLPVLHNGSKMHVQPTSISQRKTGIKSSCAQPPGPRPNFKIGQKRKEKKNQQMGGKNENQENE